MQKKRKTTTSQPELLNIQETFKNESLPPPVYPPYASYRYYLTNIQVRMIIDFLQPRLRLIGFHLMISPRLQRRCGWPTPKLKRWTPTTVWSPNAL
ncbi:hypothetical protein THIOM_004979 [Candidatus Thiomargarita nelsonii]|uniref:Uncharacterized protein n=1 Tax=Candidatus Thiomargarita nelsonii TaxID=1003181 RepID=A0A176RUG8_9GAMM|nr:hypothetical protein THIOM_004979 [Candidatus Thiomargarita nelsonii]